MNKLLLKRAFKSLFRNKLFVILMSVLVLITSASYTLFESSSSSFKKSYNQVMSSGALHDLVIKENFQIAPQDEVSATKVQKLDGSYVDLDGTSLEQNKIAVPGSQKDFTVNIAADKIYSQYGLSMQDTTIPVPFSMDSETPTANDFASKVAEVSSSAKSIIESKIKLKLKESFIDGIEDIYSNQYNLNAKNIADFNEMSSISIESGVSAYKVIQYNADTKVNKLNIYDGTNQFIQPLSDKEMLDSLDVKKGQANAANGAVFGPANTSKGYKITTQSAAGDVISVYDASAYQAVISPTFANQNNKKSLSLNDFYNLINQWPYTTSNGGQFNFFDALSNKVPDLVQKYSDYIIWVDQMPYIITGIGVTPDFSYPIIDEKHPTIDPAHQALVYVNNRGFQRAVDSFRTNPKENYISVRFHDDVSSEDRERYKKEFEEFCQTGVSTQIQGKVINVPKNSFTSGVSMVTNYDDPNDQMTLTQERVSFLSKLKDTITTISYTTTTLLIIFVSIIVAMVFGVLISSSRKSLSTLLAIGYTKMQIAVSTSMISLMIGALPSLVGYLIGFGSHFAFINAFDAFWTLPTYGNAFSIVSLMVTVIAPAALLFVLIMIVTLLSLNFPIPDMLKDSVRDNSWIVARIMTPFKGLGIKTKYAIALTLRNSGKVLLVSLTTIIASIALMVGISTVGQASSAYSSTVASTNYEYKVDLYSPTTEGGQYSRIYYGKDANGNLGYFTDAAKTQEAAYGETYNNSEMSDDDRALPHWHVPGVGDKEVALPDSPSKITDKNKLSNLERQISSYLKNKIQTKGLINKSVTAGVNPWSTASQLMPDNQLNTANDNLEKIIKIAQDRNINISSTESFIRFINMPDVAELVRPYLITYDTVVTDDGDETYTYIDSDINIKNQTVNYHITGITNNSSMYNISSSTINELNNDFYDNPSFVPVIINKYVAANYELSNGDTFDGIVKNDSDRNFANHTEHTITYRVVGIVDSYNDAGFVTTQKIANQVIGLSSGAFNGVMSKNKNSSLLTSLPLYSPSGIYFATDTLMKGSAWEDWLNVILKDPSVWKYEATIAANFDEFIKQYSNSPLSSVINKVEWQEMNQLTFKSVSRLTAILIDLIEGLTIVLSVVFTIIVISLIVRTNRKRIATLWTIGYRKREITRIFASNLIVPVIVAFAVAAPVTVGLLAALKEFIMHFGHILIPFELTAWIPFVVIAAITLVYIAATSLSVRSLSSAGALEAFKED